MAESECNTEVILPIATHTRKCGIVLPMQQTERLPGETDEQYDIRTNKDVAAFSYIWIMAVVIYALRKDSKFVRFHCKQALVLFLVSILVWLIPFIGGFLIFIIVAGMLLGFINAAQGRFADVPLAGPLSRGEMTVGDLWNMAKPFFKRIADAFSQIFSTSHVPKPPDAHNAQRPSAPPSPHVPHNP